MTRRADGAGAGRRVYLSCIGTFHHFDLARQLAARDRLARIFSSYPGWKQPRTGIPPERIASSPWLYAPYMALGRILPGWASGGRPLAALRAQACALHDRTVARSLHRPGVLVGLSGHNHRAGRRMQELGGIWICDRGSTHARHQAEVLAAEFRRVGLPPPPSAAGAVRLEEREYAACDLITVPTRFARRTFLERGHHPGKVRVVPYGVDLSRFRPVGEPPRDRLRLLFVGGVGVRKGVHDLLAAFAALPIAARQLDIVGAVAEHFRPILARYAHLGNLTVHGALPQTRLAELYSRAHFLVLPSIEEGLALVQGQAMACACPVVSTPQAGAEDLYDDGQEGLLVPIHRPDLIAERIRAAWEDGSCWRMRSAALARVRTLGGWDDYGRRFLDLVDGCSAALR